MDFNIKGLEFKNIESMNEHLKNSNVQFSLLQGRKISLQDDHGKTSLFTANQILEELANQLKKSKYYEDERESIKTLYATCEGLKNKGYEGSTWKNTNAFTRLITTIKHIISNLFRPELPALIFNPNPKVTNKPVADEQRQQNPNTPDEPLAEIETPPALNKNKVLPDTLNIPQENPNDIEDDNPQKPLENIAPQKQELILEENPPEAEEPVEEELAPPVNHLLINNPDELVQQDEILVEDQQDELDLKEQALLQFEQNPEQIQHSEFKNDLDFVKLAIQKNPEIYRYLDIEEQNNPELMKLVMKHASISKEVALLVLQKDGLLIKNLSYPLNMNEELVNSAIEQNPHAYRFMHPSLKNKFYKYYELEKKVCNHADCSEDLVLEILQEVGGWILEDLPIHFKNDPDIWIVAFRSKPQIWTEVRPPQEYIIPIEDIKKALGNESCPENFVVEQMQRDGLLLKDCSWTFKKEPRILKAAVSQNGLALEYANKTYAPAHDKEIALLAVKNNPEAYKFIHGFSYTLAQALGIIQETLAHPDCPADLKEQLQNKIDQMKQNFDP